MGMGTAFEGMGWDGLTLCGVGYEGRPTVVLTIDASTERHRRI